ncbi:MAG: PilZ domain-containing protein [Gammaproteobacteria bacterium]|nr:MAG: PilZ domain-containing protein [Gammaproteobacteria bacterium]
MILFLPDPTREQPLNKRQKTVHRLPIDRTDPGENGDDRRRHSRIDLPGSLISNDGIWAVNLSETGAALRSRTAFEPDAIIEITLALPSCKQKVLVRVVWCRKALSISEGEFLVGVAFVALSRATRRAIQAYITDRSEPAVCLDSSFG